MRWQATGHSCLPSAVANGCKSLGKEVSEEQVEAAIAKTQRKGSPREVEGTTQLQAKRALEAMKCEYSEFSLAHAEAAWRTLRSFLADGYPVLLAVDDDEHWVVAVGTVGKRVLVADGADTELVVSYDHDQMMKRWGAHGDVILYYGLAYMPMNGRRKK